MKFQACPLWYLFTQLVGCFIAVAVSEPEARERGSSIIGKKLLICIFQAVCQRNAAKIDQVTSYFLKT